MEFDRIMSQLKFNRTWRLVGWLGAVGGRRICRGVVGPSTSTSSSGSRRTPKRKADGFWDTSGDDDALWFYTDVVEVLLLLTDGLP